MATLHPIHLHDATVRQHLPFSYTGIVEDIIRLKQLLKTALSHLNWQPQVQPVILNLACGRADETGMMIDALALSSVNHPLCHYIGLDLRERELQEASLRWRPRSLSCCDIEFRQANLSVPHTWQNLPRAHAIIIRHQNFFDDPQTWDRILNRAMTQLLPGGIMILTSYFDQEHQLALASLQSNQTTVLWNARHLHSRMLDARILKSVDRHLAILSHAK